MNESITLNVTKEFKAKLQYLADNDNRKLSAYCKVQLEKIIEGIEIPKKVLMCEPSVFTFIRFEAIEIKDQPRVKLKKFICAICPSCRAFTFDLNTEIMQGSCLSCRFKSTDYKADMIKLRGNNINETNTNGKSLKP